MAKDEYMSPEELMEWAEDHAEWIERFFPKKDMLKKGVVNAANSAQKHEKLASLIFDTIVAIAAYQVHTELQTVQASYTDEGIQSAMLHTFVCTFKEVRDDANNPLFPVDADGLTALFSNKGTHALVQARFEKALVQKKEETGKVFYTKGRAGATRMKKFQKGKEEPFPGLNPVAVNLMSLSHAQLCAQNRHHRVTPKTANRFVTIPLTQWMDACKLTDRKAAKRQLTAASELLLGITLFVDDDYIYEELGADNRYHRKVIKLPPTGINVLGSTEWIDPQTLRLEFSGGYVTYLADTHIEHFPLQHALKLDSNKEKVTRQIEEVVFERWNTNRMKRAEKGLDPNVVSISVPLLIQKCPELPLESELTAGQKKNKSRTYYNRITAALDKLLSDGVITRWSFCHRRGVPLLPGENPKTWRLFKTLYIRVEIDAERQKEIACESAEKQKKRKKAAADAKKKKSTTQEENQEKPHG